MKEFLLGGALAIWLVILGLSTLNTLFAVLTFLYPVIIVLLVINYQLIKRFVTVHKKKKVSL